MLYAEIAEAKSAAEKLASEKSWEHAYVYQQGDKYGAMAHMEDRYVFGYVPAGAWLVQHGTGRQSIDGRWRWIWDTRGLYTTEEYRVIADELGGDKARAIWEVLTGGDTNAPAADDKRE